MGKLTIPVDVVETTSTMGRTATRIYVALRRSNRAMRIADLCRLLDTTFRPVRANLTALEEAGLVEFVKDPVFGAGYVAR